MAVPDAAVSVLAGVSSVYVIKDGKITQQSVTLGVRQGDMWEVTEGLKGDEVLAASRLNELASGVRCASSKAGEAEGGPAPGERGAGGGSRAWRRGGGQAAVAGRGPGRLQGGTR